MYDPYEDEISPAPRTSASTEGAKTESKSSEIPSPGAIDMIKETAAKPPVTEWPEWASDLEPEPKICTGEEYESNGPNKLCRQPDAVEHTAARRSSLTEVLGKIHLPHFGKVNPHPAQHTDRTETLPPPIVSMEAQNQAQHADGSPPKSSKMGFFHNHLHHHHKEEKSPTEGVRK